MTLRPDEIAMQGDINRSKEINRGASTVLNTAIGAGVGAIGASLGSKIMPFLSEYIPSGLALKGIQKVAPKFGEMLKNGMDQGLDLKEGLNYLKDNISNQSEKNIIEKKSNDLYQALKHAIKGKGVDPATAAFQAMNTNNEFLKISRELEKETGDIWADIVSKVFTGKKAEMKKAQKGVGPIEPHSGPRVSRERSPEIQRIPQEEDPMVAQQQAIPTNDRWNQIADRLQNLLNS